MHLVLKISEDVFMDITTKIRIHAINHIKDPLYRNSYFLMLNTVIGSALGFVFWMVVARFYSVQEVGFATAIFSAIGLVGIFSRLGFGATLIRYLPNETDKNGLINSCLTIMGLFSIALAIIFIVGLDLWSPALLFIRNSMIFSLSFIAVTCISAGLILNNVFIAFRRADFSFCQNTMVSALKILLVIFLTSFGVMGIFASWSIAISISFLISIFFLLPKIQPNYLPIPTIKKGIVDRIVNYSLGNYIVGVFESAPILILPLLIVNVLGAEMTAYFYIAWMIAGILYSISAATTSSLFAEGSNKPEELRKDVIRAIKFMFFLLIPAIIGILLFGGKLLMLFGKSYSENSLILLYIMAISSVPCTLNRIYITIKRVQLDIKPIIYACGFIAIFTVLGSYSLMIRVGLVGVGIAWILGQGIVSVVVGLWMVQKFKEFNKK